MNGPIDQLILWAQTRPDTAALRGENVRVGYVALLQHVQARAAWLHGAGVRGGDVVALSFSEAGGTLSGQVATFYAIAWLGAVVLPLYPELKSERRSAYVDQLGARWLVSEPLAGNTAAHRLDPSDYTEAHWVGRAVPRGDLPTQAFHYEFTSGTTGEPKAIAASHAEYVAIRCNAMAVYGWRQDDVVLAPTRWPTKVGIRLLLRTLYVGASFLDMPFPDSRQELVALANNYGLSNVTCSPWQVRRLLASEPLQGNMLVPLSLLIAVGAPVTPDEILATRHTLVANFHVVYASTEIGLMGHLDSNSPHDAPFKPMPGMQAQALDDQGQPLPAGQLGRLRFRAPWLPQAYAVGTMHPVEGFHNGWFVSSDRGLVDAQGGIRLHGRADDTINVGGIKVHPRDVENVLLSHPDVMDVAVLGVPETMAGEVAVAFFVTRRPITVQAMLDFLSTRVGPAEVPAAYIGIDAIPRNPEGKVLLQPLRDYFSVWAKQQAALRAGR